ncbi:MAG: Glu/Leu/Phe/Val dehydrogenase dimerization domain-containing protein [Paracoccaceae bacterium]
MSTGSVFSHPEFDDHEEVVFARDPAAGLSAIIAVHDTTLGPAMGGCRVWSYKTDGEALTDVLRLSRGMSYKAALAGMPFGGGKSVIVTAPGQAKTPHMMRAMGRIVDRLGGRYIIAEDVGTSVEDMDLIAGETKHVAGVSGYDGDPSPSTALGVFLCTRSAVRRRFGRDLTGCHVAVKGLGHVGYELCRLLHEAGAKLTVADIDRNAVARASEAFRAQPAKVDEILTVEADVFAPCALGKDLSAVTIPRMRAGIVCGSANNQLATPEDDERLRRREILYCPDYLVNAGGLISAAGRLIGLTEDGVRQKLDALPDTLDSVLDTAEKTGRAPGATADSIARARFRPTHEPQEHRRSA